MIKVLEFFGKSLNILCKKRIRMASSGGNKEFVGVRNGITGENEWILVGEDYDYLQEIGRSAYADMLHDQDRNDKYYTAIKRAVEIKHGLKEEAIVLDIGTGTGLLSMMAKRSKADRVFACDAFTPMLNCARKVIKRNGFSEEDIKLIAKRSTELRVGVDFPVRCNILVTEVFDTELIGEGAFQTYNHALEHLLTPDCIVVPLESTVYIRFVKSDLLRNFNTLPSELVVDKEVKLQLPKTILECSGVPSVHDLQLANAPMTFISEPFPVFTFKFNQTLEKFRVTEVPSFKEADGAILYWTLKMDDQGTEISCEPNNAPWRDHWMQAFYYIPPSLLNEPSIQFSHDEFSFWFGPSCTQCFCGIHKQISRTRILSLQDVSKYQKLLESLGKLKTSPNSIVVLSDQSLLPFILAVKYKNARITSIGENCFQNILTSSSNITFLSRSETTHASLTQLMTDNTAVVGDPYFTTSVHLWENLRFFQLLKSTGMQKGVNIIPGKAVLRIAAFDFEHLYKIKAPVKTTCGFNLQDFDNLIMGSIDQVDSMWDAQPLWEYDSKLVSEVINVMTIDPDMKEQEAVGTLKLTPTAAAAANGLVMWIDWILDDSTVLHRQYDQIKNQWDTASLQSVHFLEMRESIDYKIRLSTNGQIVTEFIRPDNK